MVKVGIIGATGYAGNELVRLLLGHKDVEIVWLGSRSYIDQKYSDVYRNMFKLVDARCMDDNMEQLADEVDVIFTATPQGLCASLVNDEILSKVKIIDLSADFRLKNVDIYEKWYKLEHKSPQYIDEAVYGLCEINRDKVNNNTRIIANPGCYTTTSILTLYPLVIRQEHATLTVSDRYHTGHWKSGDDTQISDWRPKLMHRGCVPCTNCGRC